VTLVIPASGVLFDNDGVLVDSREAGEQAWRRWATGHGLDPDTVLAGVHGRRSVETVARFLTHDRVAAATAQVDALELENAGSTRPLPGAADLLSSVPHDRWVVVTSAARTLAAARIDGAGLPQPPRIVAAEDVTAGKPAPDPYEHAAVLLGLPPAACVAFEDSDNGIASARAAGVAAVVGVGPGARGHGCDVVVEDLRAVRWIGNGLEILEALEIEEASA
jgi:mannitol-1-/sugar-/sorbitol-6-phosphatase